MPCQAIAFPWALQLSFFFVTIFHLHFGKWAEEKKVKVNNKRPQPLLPIAICPSTANWQVLILSSRRQFLFLKIMFCLQTRPDKLVANICFFPNGISTNTGIACSIDFRFFFQNKTDHNLSPDLFNLLGFSVFSTLNYHSPVFFIRLTWLHIFFK